MRATPHGRPTSPRPTGAPDPRGAQEVGTGYHGRRRRGHGGRRLPPVARRAPSRWLTRVTTHSRVRCSVRRSCSADASPPRRRAAGRRRRSDQGAPRARPGGAADAACGAYPERHAQASAPPLPPTPREECSSGGAGCYRRARRGEEQRSSATMCRPSSPPPPPSLPPTPQQGGPPNRCAGRVLLCGRGAVRHLPRPPRLPQHCLWRDVRWRGDGRRR